MRSHCTTRNTLIPLNSLILPDCVHLGGIDTVAHQIATVGAHPPLVVTATDQGFLIAVESTRTWAAIRFLCDNAVTVPYRGVSVPAASAFALVECVVGGGE